jgi:hypothetical protein
MVLTNSSEILTFESAPIDDSLSLTRRIVHFDWTFASENFVGIDFNIVTTPHKFHC